MESEKERESNMGSQKEWRQRNRERQSVGTEKQNSKREPDRKCER